MVVLFDRPTCLEIWRLLESRLLFETWHIFERWPITVILLVLC